MFSRAGTMTARLSSIGKSLAATGRAQDTGTAMNGGVTSFKRTKNHKAWARAGRRQK